MAIRKERSKSNSYSKKLPSSAVAVSHQWLLNLRSTYGHTTKRKTPSRHTGNVILSSTRPLFDLKSQQSFHMVICEIVKISEDWIFAGSVCNARTEIDKLAFKHTSQLNLV